MPTHSVGGFHKTSIGMDFRARLQAAIDSQTGLQAVELALFSLRLLALQLQCRAAELDL